MADEQETAPPRGSDLRDEVARAIIDEVLGEPLRADGKPVPPALSAAYQFAQVEGSLRVELGRWPPGSLRFLGVVPEGAFRPIPPEE